LSEDNVVVFDKKNKKEQIDELLDDIRRIAVENNWTKSMVILLDDNGDLYNTTYMHPDLKTSEALALLEVVKDSIFDDMKL